MSFEMLLQSVVLESDDLFWLAGFHALLGIFLGLRYRILVLAPVFGVIGIEAIFVGARMGWGTGLILAVLLVVILQIGYALAFLVHDFIGWLCVFVQKGWDFLLRLAIRLTSFRR